MGSDFVLLEDLDDRERRTRETMLALSIGEAVLAYMKQAGVMQDIYRAVDSRAVRMLEMIARALDDDTLDDPECFWKIERVMDVLEENWLGSSRHDW
ncbi:hypothetical protein [uncultured Oscillibacter sp.]|uniref:hypothetical protein n=1 Tax=uncultured Oscillibacter sp. TaxID=876091 RepID=UPI00260FC231|nr:hypothetical protein [uncultured Oscillibacter sp.]